MATSSKEGLTDEVPESENKVTGYDFPGMAARTIELYNRGGAAELSRGVIDFLDYQLWRHSPFYHKSPYHPTRVDNDGRWQFISDHLDEEHELLLDIGCADGFFTRKAAEHGLKTTGIDVEKKRVESAREKLSDTPDAKVELRHITPDNVDELPDSDVTLLLTVHHHWDKHFGRENALEMLKTIASKTDLLVYEPPGDQFLNGPSIDPDESIEAYEELIDTTFDNNVVIKDVEMFDYKSKDPETRSDPIFIIGTSV